MFYDTVQSYQWVQAFWRNIKKAKGSRNRPHMAQRVTGCLDSQISMTFGTWRWWGRQSHAPATFTPRKFSWYSFSLEAESTPGPWFGRKEYVTEKSSDTTGRNMLPQFSCWNLKIDAAYCSANLVSTCKAKCCYNSEFRNIKTHSCVSPQIWQQNNNSYTHQTVSEQDYTARF